MCDPGTDMHRRGSVLGTQRRNSGREWTEAEDPAIAQEPRRYLLKATAAAALLLSPCVLLLPESARATPTGASAARSPTTVYNVGGTSIGSILPDGPGAWTSSSLDGCSVYRNVSKSGTSYSAEFTHSAVGGLVRVRGANVWKAWAGTRLMGRAVTKSPSRADFYGRTGRRLGYAIGPDPLAAAAARLILDLLYHCGL